MNSTHEKPAKIINKCVRIQADDIFLLGDLQVPEESQNLVLFACGGRTRNNPRNLHAARMLREKGMATLLCDLMTEDEEAEDEVSGKFRQDAALLARRLMGVTRWLKSQADTKKLELGYFGACAGGAAALIAAAKMKNKIRAVVSRGGRLDLAARHLPHVACPTLLIVGEDDTVGLELNREALPRLNCEKDLKIVPGATHLFGEPGAFETMGHLCADWFHSHFTKVHA